MRHLAIALAGLLVAAPALAEGDDALNPNTRPLRVDKTPRPATQPSYLPKVTSPNAQGDPAVDQDGRGYGEEVRSDDDMTRRSPECAHAPFRVYRSVAEVRRARLRCRD
jgi:hypothetical protein